MSLKKMPRLINKTKQKGNFIIVSLVIIIVILALGLALVRVLSGAANQNAVEYYGARAFMAAQSGLESGLTELFPINNDSQNCASVTTHLTFNVPYLAFCNVNISCDEYIELPDNSTQSGAVNIYYLASTATCDNSDCPVAEECRKEYWQTQRTLSLEAKTLP
ncbi:agglutinin biogenesis protein MshP [Pseudoalteromonas sp. MMG010]|uniref:agglutinin biogenesis protein MshP n=1 Tax=Pseudoalteromonas sp. MMG010 TaxID=2822685 RepID=UPI001FFC4B0B|nr:agglutinin biogenesis protein MshP [Pseudoalteromonas sp. MMG010]